MANKELELKSVDGRGGGIVNDPHQPNHISSGEPLQHSMSEEEIIAEEERELNSVDGGEEIGGKNPNPIINATTSSGEKYTSEANGAIFDGIMGLM